MDMAEHDNASLPTIHAVDSCGMSYCLDDFDKYLAVLSASVCAQTVLVAPSFPLQGWQGSVPVHSIACMSSVLSIAMSMAAASKER